MNKIGFLFDLDGVIIDSEGEYTRIWETIDREFPTGKERFAYVIKGMTLPEILAEYYPDSEVQPKVVARLNSMEQEMRYPYLPGARELLEELRQRELEAVLVTSSNDMKMRHLREEQPELESYFSYIVTADRISHSKPDPEGYLLGAKLLGAAPGRCVVFEDSLQGVKAGRTAGCHVVGLATTLPAETISPYCNEVVRDLSQVDLSKIISILQNEVV